MSLLFSDANHSDAPENQYDILNDEQRRFIDDACDVPKMIDESREFRRKFDFFVRLDQLFVNLSNEVTEEALDVGKEQAFRIRIENMQYGIPKFRPTISTSST